MKNMNGEEVTRLEDWEKAVVAKYIEKHGLPTWAGGANLFKLLVALADMTEEQAQQAMQRAQEEEEKLYDTTPPEEDTGGESV